MRNRSRLPLIALRAFEAAARSGGVRRAADELRVSQQLRLLETRLGVPLVTRGAGRHLTLTSDGTVLLGNLTAAFDLLEHSIGEVQAAHGSRRLRVRILPTLAIRWFIPRLGSFFERHGGIDVEVSTAAERECLLDPEDDFVAWHGRGDWPDVHFQMLFPDAFLPVCNQDLAATLNADRPALAGAIRLHSMLRPDAWRIWLDANGIAGIDPNAGPRFANASLAYQAAIEGLGVAIAQSAYVENDLLSGKLVAPWPDPVGTDEGYYLVCAKAKAGLPKHQAFLSWMRDCLRRDAERQTGHAAVS